MTDRPIVAVQGWFADLVVADVARSIDFYQDLLDLDVTIFEGWYAELAANGTTCLALVVNNHETIPPAAHRRPAGVLLTFTVTDARAVHSTARDRGHTVVADLRDEFGQRHFMLLDPDGTVVDIIERIPITTVDLERLAHLRQPSTRA